MKKETNAGTRLASMLVDHFAMTFIAMIFFIPSMISIFSTAFQVSHEQTSPDIFGSLSIVGFFGFALYFCKDSINGRSIAKRILNIQVVDYKTGQVASPLKCFFRNLFCIVWPIEVIITLVNPSRRIGDMVAGTKIVPFNPDIEQSKPNYRQIVLSIALAYGLILVFTVPFMGLKSMIKSNQISYIETSLNETSAEETVQLFKERFGDELSADVKIYDQIEENPNLKYISVILTLSEDYLDDDQDYNEIKEKTLPILLSKYQQGTFVGQIKYVYKKPGSMITRTLPLNSLFNE